MALGRGVEGGNPHQAMHPAFAFEKTVGVFAADLKCAGAQAGFVAVLPIEGFHAEPAALGPAAVHALKHLRPIASLGAPRPRLDHQEARRVIAWLIQQGEQFVSANVVLEALGVADGLTRQFRVIELLGQRHSFFNVCHAQFKLEKGLKLLFQSARLGTHGLGLIRSTPKIGRAHGLLEGIDFRFQRWDVKDTS